MRCICRNCHFLSKEHRVEGSGQIFKFSLSQAEREKAKTSPLEIIPSHYSLNCIMGVWDEAVSGSIQDRESTLNKILRDSACFFFPHRPAMLFEAARELQKRQSELTQMKKSNLYTRIGLWVAAGALAFSALVEYLENL